jgi:hypothetical protein
VKSFLSQNRNVRLRLISRIIDRPACGNATRFSGKSLSRFVSLCYQGDHHRTQLFRQTPISAACRVIAKGLTVIRPSHSSVIFRVGRLTQIEISGSFKTCI